MQGILSRMTTAQASVGDWQALYKVNLALVSTSVQSVLGVSTVTSYAQLLMVLGWGRGRQGVIGSVAALVSL